MLTTTLNEIYSHNPCETSWNKLLLKLNKTEPDNEKLTLVDILNHLGLKDAIWSLRTQEKKYSVDFACACACRVLSIYEKKYPENNTVRFAIEIASNYSFEDRKDIEMTANAANTAIANAIATAAYGTPHCTDVYAAAATVYAVNAVNASDDTYAYVANAANATNAFAEKKEQEKIFIEICGKG